MSLCLSLSRKVGKTGRATTGLKNFLNVLHTGEGGGWYGSDSTQPSHSSERSESQKFQGNSMRNRNPFSMAFDLEYESLKSSSSARYDYYFHSLRINIFPPFF